MPSLPAAMYPPSEKRTSPVGYGTVATPRYLASARQNNSYVGIGERTENPEVEQIRSVGLYVAQFGSFGRLLQQAGGDALGHFHPLERLAAEVLVDPEPVQVLDQLGLIVDRRTARPDT